MPTPTLLHRLKERKLVQWALAYLAGAFVVFQLLDALSDPLGLTPTIQRAILAIVGIGFFITLVLAWYHGEKGRQRVSGPELLMVAALLVVAGVALSLLSDDEPVPEPPQVTAEARAGDDRPAIAVLPCENMSTNPEDEFLAPGLHDAILLRLQKISGLFSIGRTSVQQYAVDPPATEVIASALRVGFVGECSVQKYGDQIRLIFQLLDGVTGGQLWAEQYDRDLTAVNLFAIQSDLSQQVASEIGAILTPDEEARIEAKPTENLEAYEAYLLGRYHLGREVDLLSGSSEALRYFEIAVERDPNLADAHAGLAWTYYTLLSLGIRDPRETWPLVERWARSALAIDSTVSKAHLLLARQHLVWTWDWEEAERRVHRVLELDPNDPEGWRTKVDLRLAQGRIEEGLREANRAAALDPVSSRTLYLQARWALLSRRYEEATPLSEVLVTRDPENALAAWYLVQSFFLGGHPEEVNQLPTRDSEMVARYLEEPSAPLALKLSLAGEADSARVMIERVVTSLGEVDRDPVGVWPTYAILGEKDEAFRWMERTIQVLSPSARHIGVDPLADPLRDDPRYQAILDRIGLGHLKSRFDSLAAADPRRGR
jgi:serine/threonine-protein kinase